MHIPSTDLYPRSKVRAIFSASTKGHLRLYYRVFFSLLISFLLSSCKPKLQYPSSYLSTDQKIDEIKQLKHKKNLYLNYLKPREDIHGWIPSHCDGLLFNSLYGIVGGSPDIKKAKNQSNKWHRTPDKNCYPNNSGSEISKDMFVGLLLYLYEKKDLVELKKLQRYGVKNNWIMGEGPLLRTVLLLDQRKNLANAIHSLESNKKKTAHVDSELPSGFGLPCTDYGCHLRSLDIYLHHQIHGSLPELAMLDLKNMVKSNPNNSLYRSILSIYDPSHTDKAISLLLNKKTFPLSRLPSNTEYCSDYINQRSETVDNLPNRDWKPCEKENTHNGLSFLLPATILIKKFENR